MPATQEKEQVFQSMQESLDKIEKNTAAMGMFAKTAEDLMEAGRAQKMRDQEQQKQTSALERISKTSAESKKDQSFFGKHWGKLLLGLLIVAALIYRKLPKMPRMPTLEEATNAFVEGQKPENIGTPKETIQLNTQLADIANRTGGGLRNLATGTKQAILKAKDTVKSSASKIRRGFIPNQEDRERIKQNQANEKAQKLDKQIAKDQKNAIKENKARDAAKLKAEKQLKDQQQKQEKAARKAAKLKLEELDKANKKAQRDAAAKAKAEAKARKITQQQAHEAEQKRLKGIAQAKIDAKNASEHAEKNTKKETTTKINEGKKEVKATKTNTNQTTEHAKNQARKGITWLRNATKITGPIAAIPIPGARVVAAVLTGTLIAAQAWADTDTGKEYLAKIKKSKKQWLEENFPEKMKKEADAKYLKELKESDSEGMKRFKMQQEATREPSWWEKTKNLFKFGGRQGQGATRIEKNVDTLVKLNPEMARMMHISGSAFDARGKTQRITSGFRNREAQIKAMENQKKSDPKQYLKNYGNVTPEEWLKTKSSKHQHGNGIDIGYPADYKDDEILKEALVSDINLRLMRAGMGFSAHAEKEGDHIHLALRGSKTKEQVRAFDIKFMDAYNANTSGTTLTGLNQFATDSLGQSSPPIIIQDNSNKSANTTALMTGHATDTSGFWHKQNNEMGFGFKGFK